MIQVVKCHFEVIFPSWPTENAPFFKLIKRRFKWQIDLKVIFCLLTSSKFYYGDVENAMFQVVANHWELIFLPLTSPKCVLRKDEKATIHGFACHFELILGLLANPKCDLSEFEKAMFQGLAWYSQLILGLWNSPKCYLDEVEKAMIEFFECHLKSFYVSWPTEIANLFMSTKRRFKWQNGTWK